MKQSENRGEICQKSLTVPAVNMTEKDFALMLQARRLLRAFAGIIQKGTGGPMPTDCLVEVAPKRKVEE